MCNYAGTAGDSALGAAAAVSDRLVMPLHPLASINLELLAVCGAYRQGAKDAVPAFLGVLHGMRYRHCLRYCLCLQTIWRLWDPGI